MLFDPDTSEGGWVGGIEGLDDPVAAAPLSLVSVVLSNYDALTNTLSGRSEFTNSHSLAFCMFGTVFGSSFDDAPFTKGGPIALLAVSARPRRSAPLA